MNLVIITLLKASVWTVPVFVLLHSAGSHMTRRKDSIMQNHSEEVGTYFKVSIEKLKAKKKYDIFSNNFQT
jgi:hypothetical protein